MAVLLDAHHDPNDNFDETNIDPSSSERIAQSFTIQRAGIIDKVDINVGAEWNDSAYKGFRYMICPDDNGDPDFDNPLGYVDVLAENHVNSTGSNGFTCWLTDLDFSSFNISVSEGDRLWLVCGEPNGTGTDNQVEWYRESYYWWGESKRSLDDGDTWADYLADDTFGFKIYVDRSEQAWEIDQDNGDVDNNDGNIGQNNWNNNRQFSQSFTSGFNGKLYRAKIYGFGNDADTGTYSVDIYNADANDKPTGASLGNIAWDIDDWGVGMDASHPDKDNDYIWLDFESENINLTKGNKYCLVLSATVSGYWNGFKWYYRNSFYGDGKAQISTDGGSTWADYGSATRDMMFETYGPPLGFFINSELERGFEINSDLERGMEMDSFLAKKFDIDAELLRGLNIGAQLSLPFQIGAYLRYADDKSRHKVSFTFNQEGTASTATSLEGGRSLARKSRISRVFLIMKDTGDVGADTVVDVNINGTTVFTDQTKRPRISGGDSLKIFGSIPDIRNIDSHDVITIDVDSVSANASDISVIVELNTATSYTHEVRRVEILDDGLLVDSENGIGYTTDTLQLRIVFDEPMNTAVEPTITWQKDSMELNPTISSGGTWSSTYERFDTYTTPHIDVSDDDNYTGTADVKISDSKNVFNEDINEYNFLIELILQALVAFDETHTSELSSNNLILNGENVERFRYSLDQTNWSSWIDYIEEIDIDLSDVGIGGPATFGLVTLYVELEDITGKIRTKTPTIYYNTALNEIENFDIIGAGRPDWWMLRWNLPVNSDNIPIDKYEVYVDSALFGEIDEVYPLNGSVEDSEDLTISSINVDNTLRKITYTMSVGKCYTLDGTEVEFGSTTDIEVNHPDTADRYDLICVDTSGNFKVISGDEGLVNREARPFEKEYTGGTGKYINLPKVPEIPVGYLPLYYVKITYIEFVGAGPATYRHASVNIDGDVYSVSKSKTSFLLYLKRTDTDQVIKVKAIGRTQAYSEYTHTFAKSPIAPPRYIDLEAYTQPNGTGTKLSSGTMINADDTPDNIIYLKFVEDE